jgi:uncharacterized protein involved in outer membrane biogenesis
VVVLAVLFLVRPGMQRLRGRLISEISQGIGRQVEISSVTFHFLPRPGFDLDGFVVHDNPEFGAEPMLRCADVSATLRLLPMLRGRMEISRLSLSDPSLNLSRNAQGRWNLEDLLERNARTPIAPTTKAKTERRAGFPYIEAIRGRINFKLGQEKTRYALTDATFSLWQGSENAWSMRLEATPMRTDQNVSDTGIIDAEGTWQRASTLHETPVLFELQWNRAQLGQFTKLFRGYDSGWRGSLRLNATLNGTPTALRVTTSVAVQDFRRYDVIGNGDLDLSATCDGFYNSSEHSFPLLSCHAPVGGGSIYVSGSVSSLLDKRAYNLTLTAQSVPMEALAALALHARKALPPDLQAEGTLDARFGYQTPQEQTIQAWTGSGSTRQFRLSSASKTFDAVMGSVPFSFQSDPMLPATRGRNKVAVQAPVGPSKLEIGPFHIASAKPQPILGHGWISRAGYEFQFSGDSIPEQWIKNQVKPASAVLIPVAARPKNVTLDLAGTWTELQPADNNNIR